MKLPRLKSVSVLVALTLALGGCAERGNHTSDGQLRIVTTTGILADLVRNVAGNRAYVSQLVPDGADPHSYEPSLRSIRDVAYADLAFSNYLLLEQHSIIKALDANLPKDSLSVSIAEEASKSGATILPLVENRSLDALWLGMRVAGQGAGATRASEVDLTVNRIEGPGEASSYLTTTFGSPEIAFSSSDGFDAGDGYTEDTTVLPYGAHQHMSWAFTKPGIYRIHISAKLRINDHARPQALKEGVLTFAVGVDPSEIASKEHRLILDHGHADLTADLQSERITLMIDEVSAPPEVQRAQGAAFVPGLAAFDLENLVISVPPRTLTEVPGSAGFRFLGHPGDDIYILPQAVLGKHVHGEIDPHLWHDVHNAAAYVKVIRDKLIAVDPHGETYYRVQAEHYLKQLEEVDMYMNKKISKIPLEKRQLVTTNDAYAYLANAYGLTIAGYVAPHPGVEPSLADRRKLTSTIESLKIKAVFLEPQLRNRRSPLEAVAQETGVSLCTLYGDTFDRNVNTYLAMVKANADELLACLGGRSEKQHHHNH